MADLTKINDVITELENQVDSMKQYGNIVAKINALSEETILLSQSVSEHAKDFVKLGDKLSKIIDENDETFSRIQNTLIERIDSQHAIILEKNIHSAEVVQKLLQQFDATIIEFKRNADAKIEQMRSDNKSFYRDFEQSLESKLEKIKISLQSDLRSELEHSTKNIEFQFTQSISGISQELSDSKEQIISDSKKNKQLTLIAITLNVTILIILAVSLIR